MSNELKDCPFCGTAPLVREIEPHVHGLAFGDFRMPDHGGSFTVECPTTNCCGLIASTMEGVASAWNRRPALAASGGNAAPKDQEPYAYHIHDNNGDGIFRLAKNIDVHRFIAVNKVPLFTTESAPNAALVAALQNLMHLADEFGIQSGVCVCGDDMKRHGNPMDCGHSPVDSGEYYTASAIEEARKALSAAGQEVGK